MLTALATHHLVAVIQRQYELLEEPPSLLLIQASPVDHVAKFNATTEAV